jgi:hypothetical protein
MHIELTDDERRQIKQGHPLEVIDSRTNDAYVLIARANFVPTPAVEPALEEFEIPEGIRISQEAYRRDLPALLQQKKLYRQWVAYHRNERVGIAASQVPLILECAEKRKLPGDEYYVGWIHECGFLVDEEIEPRLQHYEAADESA